MKKLFFAFIIITVFNTCTIAQYTKLLDFDSINGRRPYDSFFSDGTYLYGMTQQGGIYDEGVIFKIKPDGSGFVKLLDFLYITSGANPIGSLISDGIYLYGMTSWGGVNNMDGVIFKIKPDGSEFVKLLDFAGPTTGTAPYGSLISDSTYLYGMTHQGGVNSGGIIFKIKPDGSEFVKLLDFSGTINGRNPWGSLISDGTYLYGMTQFGGTNDEGVVFKIKPDGSGYIKLLDFADNTNGSFPSGSLIFDGTYLYGMTQEGGVNNEGVIFKIKPDGSGYVNLLNFSGTTNGRNPQGSLTFDGTYLYGMTQYGGANDKGVIFKIKPDGSGYIKLLDFEGITNGEYPLGSFISDGNYLYGMAFAGGANNYGVIFKINKNTQGINEINENNTASIYPNPAEDNITIESQDKSIIKILNIVGQTVMEIQTQDRKTKIDINGLENGIYILKLINNNKTKTIKFIKE